MKLHIKEELNAEEFEELLDHLKNDFSSGYRDTDDETYFDIDLDDRFVASVDLQNGIGYFYWNPDGNATPVGPEFDVTTEDGYQVFSDMIWDALDSDYTLYVDGLESIGFNKISNNVYQRVETNKFSNDVETITATFDFNNWTGEVEHSWENSTDYNEINEFTNFFDFCEDAEIIR